MGPSLMPRGACPLFSGRYGGRSRAALIPANIGVILSRRWYKHARLGIYDLEEAVFGRRVRVFFGTSRLVDGVSLVG